ncbi:AbrB/MazE/SpoVT family DNA-binding domain-containing protein [Nitratidesulfovibrio liaohensis]|uniref:AbrB/MazE/SpoVT family DNA-binding domain-containing protein n=1 Tax=Nitratidesulfovibrio liaohensis TaxID=2604158 RepID=A0ABY9R2V7_9BACT|nr:AbrB/MazE/SpoVT family DNA-binding domain-containing protein [Nitratidesulfovibrio liaohensis]WMW65779.1 AbrB/MazE/SpoVT family DNA-binding domain-containing protein [Nitratidesulfovibrio liaohensis]
MQALKIRKIGDELGVLLPEDTLSHLNAREGDTVWLSKSPDGSLRIAIVDEKLAEQMTVAAAIMREDDAVLRELAKR